MSASDFVAVFSRIALCLLFVFGLIAVDQAWDGYRKVQVQKAVEAAHYCLEQGGTLFLDLDGRFQGCEYSRKVVP